LREKGLKALQYWGSKELELRNSFEFVKEALVTDVSYHVGPQMYTSCLVSRDLINKIRHAQNEKLILCHPQDAALAASLLKFSTGFLWSGKPISWVGTSERSAGLAITKLNGSQKQIKLAEEYVESISNSSISSSPIDFRHGVDSRYFLDALNVVWPEVHRMPEMQSRLFRLRVDANILACRRWGFLWDFGLSKRITTGSSLPLAVLLAMKIKFERNFYSTILKSTARVFRGLLHRRNGYQSIDYEANMDALFHKAMQIRSDN
jgi:hypothetical protein